MEHVVNYSENSITFKLGIYNYTQRVEIINFIKALILLKHFAVYAVNRQVKT